MFYRVMSHFVTVVAIMKRFPAEHLHGIPIWEKQIFFVDATSGLKDKTSNKNYIHQILPFNKSSGMSIFF